MTVGALAWVACGVGVVVGAVAAVAAEEWARIKRNGQGRWRAAAFLRELQRHAVRHSEEALAGKYEALVTLWVSRADAYLAVALWLERGAPDDEAERRFWPECYHADAADERRPGA